ncbi:G-protein coupled receptor Mth2-like [Camponotus floridanus]|uniref:G-protein coupled receptor Mth2-like n=1 Tax=Camponotus floridanus TaxID=104421 RepID=UPI00059EAA25|nr:G-protein coupled receptor Mth2-like [Camponotus floridanus]
MMCGKNLAFWYCILPFTASSSVFWTNFISDNEEKDYSTVQLDANTMMMKKRNYNDEEDRYNFHENFTKNNDDMQYMYSVNFTNNREHDDLIQYKFRAHAEKNHENDNQMLADNIVPYKMCDNITCIRLCCPFGNYLVNGKCIAEQGKFIFLENIYGYVNNSLNNENKGELFLLVVHDPCPKTGHYLLNSYYNTFLPNGSLYLPYYNTIIESTSYCFATVDNDIFAVNVCLESIKKIMNKTINYNEDAIHPIIKISTDMNITNTIDKSGSTSLEYFKNFNIDNDQNNISSYNMCDNITCIRLCCPFGSNLINGICIAVQGNFIFLQNLYGYINNSLQNESERREELFLLIVQNPCQDYYSLYPYNNTFLADGSVYLSKYNTTIESTSYCLANVRKDEFTVNICWEIMKEINVEIMNQIMELQNDNETYEIVLTCAAIGHILLSLVIFIVYSIVPELRNKQGFILRNYSGLAFIGEIIIETTRRLKRNEIDDFICIARGFIIYYIPLAMSFWLNVMCFDMWRTFRQMQLRNTKQQERKKLIIYSVFAFGGPFMLAIICGIIEVVPGVPNNIRPNFSEYCGIGVLAYMLYGYPIETISSISTICLCICTAQKIAYYEKDIARHLKDSESRRYNDNKEWFKICVQVTKLLFINYCIYWSLITIQVLYHENLFSIKYLYIILKCIQRFCIMIIFLWKKTIWQQLLKQLGCQNCNMFSTEHVMTSSNNTTTSEMNSLRENTDPYANRNHHAKSSSDSTDL